MDFYTTIIRFLFFGVFEISILLSFTEMMIISEIPGSSLSYILKILGTLLDMKSSDTRFRKLNLRLRDNSS